MTASATSTKSKVTFLETVYSPISNQGTAPNAGVLALQEIATSCMKTTLSGLTLVGHAPRRPSRPRT